MRDKMRGTGRRKFLMAAGAGVFGPGMTQRFDDLLQARSRKFDEIYEASLKILERVGPEAQAKFLERHEIPHTYEQRGYVMYPPEAREDDVGTEDHFDDDACIEPENCDYDPDLRCNFSLTYNRVTGSYKCSLSAEYRYKYWYDDTYCQAADLGWTLDGPLNPQDAFGIMWEQDSWKLVDRDYPANSTYSSDNVDWDNGSALGEGAGFRADDRQQCYDSGATETEPYDDGCYEDEGLSTEWSNILYGGVEIETGSDWQSGDPVQGKYVYQYDDQNVDFSVGVSYPWGVSVSFSSSTTTKQKDTQTEPDGKNMELTASDASGVA